MAAARPAQYVPDPHVDGLADAFRRFLTNFSPANWMPVASEAEGEEGAVLPMYAKAIQEMVEHQHNVLPVDFSHLQEFDDAVAAMVEAHFQRAEPVMRVVLQDYVREHHNDFLLEAHGVDKEFFLGFYNMPAVEALRDLRTELIGKLLSFSGTVTRTSEVRPELLLGTFRCMECNTAVPRVEQQYKFTQPLICPNPSCNNKQHWSLVREDSVFADWQRVKVQENVDEIPGGSLPRMMDVVLRASNVDSAKPGDRITFTGMLVVAPDVSVLATPGEKVLVRPAVQQGQKETGEGITGLKALGARELTYKLLFMGTSAKSTADRSGAINIRPDGDETTEQVLEGYGPQQREWVQQMRSSRDIFHDLARSVCPSVYGHDHVKQALLLMLLGGVHKRTKEGINLRGDINVAIIGDPSCAKSQLLKWVAAFLPRAVYTSGKASTAAGLTASVVKEPENGEFAIEAGALMLADNGICCIDEFDKMDQKDQVAIHEAMEQQTISIAKAGIQATLNARASVLAAANPIGGRYDKARPLRNNIALPPAILSRFDLLHVMVDDTTEYEDERIATHIVALHRAPGATLRGAAPFGTQQLQAYIKYARAIKPRLTQEAQQALVRAYKRLRGEDAAPGSSSAYRITVRQLEALVRLSEAMARVYCSHSVEAAHVREAAKLLASSILKVDQAPVELAGLDAEDEEGLDRNGAVDGLLAAQGLPHDAAAGAAAGAAAAGAGSAEPMEGVETATAQAGAAASPAAQTPRSAEAAGASGADPPAGTATKISAQKYEYIKAQLLRRLQQDADEKAAARGAADTDAVGDDAAAGTDDPALMAGMRQEDLVQQYLMAQIERGSIKTIEAGEEEHRLVYRVINHILKREGLLVVVSARVKRQAGESEDAFRVRLAKERVLALSPAYVPE